MRWMMLAVLLVGTLGCGNKLKRLSSAERDHFYALKVYMDEDARKSYLKYKTEEERDAWLKKKGLWDHFYKYEKERRDAIVAGEVEEGWTQDQVLMAWGAPHDKKRLVGRPASRSDLFVYKFEVDEEGYVTVWAPGSKTAHRAVDLYRMEVFIDDAVITELKRQPGW